MTIQTIEAVTFLSQSDVNSSSIILDVRTPAEFRGDALVGCINLPLDQLSPESLAQQTNLQNAGVEKIYLLCQSGARARKAAEKLTGHTSTTLVVVNGGLQKIRQLQGIAPETQVMSLERQVRIVAGGLVLLGVIIGFALHPTGFVVSGFVGVGLIFAGITNTCAMAMVMAKAPWNR